MYGVQTNEYKTLAPKPNYEFVVKDIVEVPNDRGQFAYNPESDAPKMATKLEWTFVGRQGTEADGVIIKKRTPAYLTSDPRNGWLKFASAVDPTFDIKVGYKDDADLSKRCIGRPVTLAISNSRKTVNGEERVYNNIDNAYPSDKPALDAAEMLATVFGATEVSKDEIPF